MSGHDGVARAVDLTGVFHAVPAEFAVFSTVISESVPARPRQLLAHRGHMTEAMERCHGGPVGLRVVARRDEASGRYAREILLTAPSGRVVQHGIVRIDLARLAPDTAAAIRAERTPLGRILIAAGLMCVVDDVQLLRVEPGPRLRTLVGDVPGGTFGRVAEIKLDGSPAIELLEIVAAEPAG